MPENAAFHRPLLIQAGDHTYSVLIREGLLDIVGDEVAKLASFRAGSACGLVTDEHVAALYAERVLASLRAAGYKPTLVVVPAGEPSKNLGQAAEIAEALIASGVDRHGFIVALGGGVVGDLAGFVASIYYRGIPCVQIPTTILAQIDSAIGGKTGVNTVSGKNLLGTFHPPALVVVDPLVLESLPAREFHAGFAEVIKHAIIQDRSLFDQLPDFRRSDEGALCRIIRRNLEIKAGIVAQDEYERVGIRALLNFGHTIGHGIEQAGEYRRFLHGEAVSLGIVAAARLSVEKAGLSESECFQIVKLLRKFELPITLTPEISSDAVLAGLGRDKKFVAGEIRFVLTAGIGQARLSMPGEVTAEDLRRAVEGLYARPDFGVQLAESRPPS